MSRCSRRRRGADRHLASHPPELHPIQDPISEQAHLLTSLIIAACSVVFSLIIATPAAYALAQFNIPGTNLVLVAILISQMIPGIVVANAPYSAYNELGLLSSYAGLILAVRRVISNGVQWARSVRPERSMPTLLRYDTDDFYNGRHYQGPIEVEA
jgi:hypothetical protein